MVVVGVLARIDTDDRAATLAALARESGVTPFELDVPEAERIGLLLEAPSLASVHSLLTTTVDGVDGVLGTWPVHVDVGEAEADLASSGRQL